MSHTVQTLPIPTWKEILVITCNIRILISVTKYRLGRSVCCFFNGNQLLTVNRNFFKENHLAQKKSRKTTNKLNIKFKGQEVILNNMIKLEKKDFLHFVKKGNIWINRLLHDLNGRRKLILAYSNGDLVNTVYCINTGINIPLFTYCCMILLPAVIEKLQKNNDVNNINEKDVKICQNLFPHFDYTPTPQHILSEYFENGLREIILQIISLSSPEEIESMNIKQYHKRNRRFVAYPVGCISCPWVYIRNGYSNIGNSSLGEVLMSGKILYPLYKHHLPENFFPNIILKDYKSLSKETKYQSEITINVFECHWAIVTIKYKNKIFCRSHVKSLRQTLTKIQGVIEVDVSYNCSCASCSEVREFANNTQNLSNYASRQIKRNILTYGNTFFLPDGIKNTLLFTPGGEWETDY